MPRRHDDRQPRRGRQPDRLSPGVPRQRPGRGTRSFPARRSDALPGRQAHGVRHLSRPPRQQPPAASCAPTSASICLVCHSARSEFGLGEQNGTGNHSSGADPAASRAQDVPLEVAPPFTTPFPASYPLQRRPRERRHALGPRRPSLAGAARDDRLRRPATPFTGTSETPPRPRTCSPSTRCATMADLFCEGCHAGERGDDQAAPPRPNPGGTTTGRTYHPADDDRANGEGRIVETRDPGGVAARRRQPPRADALHDLPPRARGPERTAAAAPAAGRPRVSARCATRRCPSSITTPSIEQDSGACSADVELNDPITGIRRTCELCHRAHNAGLGTERETEYVPLLREGRLSDDSCLRCHPADNPTCGETAGLPGQPLPRRPDPSRDLRRRRPAAAADTLAGVQAPLALRRGQGPGHDLPLLPRFPPRGGRLGRRRAGAAPAGPFRQPRRVGRRGARRSTFAPAATPWRRAPGQARRVTRTR